MELYDFFFFFSERNLLSKYFKNAEKGHDEIFIEQCLRDWHADDAINGAFVWRQSEEGFDFWKEIDKEWKDYVNERAI